MNDSCLDAVPRPGSSTFPIKHQILTIRLSLQIVFRFCRQIYTQPMNLPRGHRHAHRDLEQALAQRRWTAPAQHGGYRKVLEPALHHAIEGMGQCAHPEPECVDVPEAAGGHRSRNRSFFCSLIQFSAAPRSQYIAS